MIKKKKQPSDKDIELVETTMAQEQKCQEWNTKSLKRDI